MTREIMCGCGHWWWVHAMGGTEPCEGRGCMCAELGGEKIKGDWCVVVSRLNEENDAYIESIAGPFGDEQAARRALEMVPDRYWPHGHAAIHRMTPIAEVVGG